MIRIHSHDREDIWFGFLAWKKQKLRTATEFPKGREGFSVEMMMIMMRIMIMTVINMTNDESNKLQWMMNMLLLMMYDT